MSWWRFALGLCLTATAGAIDAVSFVRFGAVYASFMSGNTVQVGLHVVAADAGPLGAFLILLGLFALGGFVGAVLVAKAGRWSLPIILLLESLLIGAALGLEMNQGPALGATALLSLAMGAQNNLVVMIRGSNAGTTFVTGTVFRFAEAAAQRVLGRDPTGAWKLHLAVWLAFAAGAALGVWSELSLGDRALAPVAAAASALTLAAFGATFAGRDRRTAAMPG